MTSCRSVRHALRFTPSTLQTLRFHNGTGTKAGLSFRHSIFLLLSHFQTCSFAGLRNLQVTLHCQYCPQLLHPSPLYGVNGPPADQKE